VTASIVPKAALTSEHEDVTWACVCVCVRARACDDSVRRVLFTVLEEGVCLAGLWRNLMTLTATLAIFVMALGRLSQSSKRVLCFSASWFGSACCHVWEEEEDTRFRLEI
jgi:hypothetical protein